MMIPHRDETLRRVIRDLIIAELAQLRRIDSLQLAHALQDEQRLGPEGFGMDSFEFMTVAGTLSSMFRLHRVGLEEYLPARPTVRQWAELLAEAINRGEHRADDPSGAIAFFSSGSTGRRTLHLHSRRTLASEVAFFAELIGRPERIFLTVPTHHIYGYLFGAMLPDYYARHAAGSAADPAADPALAAALGAASASVPPRSVPELLELRGLALVRPSEAARGEPGAGDLVIAFPTALEQLLASGRRPEAGATVVTSTAPCPEYVASEVRCAGARLIEVYGSTETAGIGYREHDRAPYRLLPERSRYGDGLKLPLGPAGDDAVLKPTELPDLLEWVDDRHVRPIGRRDGAVQVGGVNVYPAKVERVLREHPEVKHAAVRASSHHSGRRLKAFVVPLETAPTIAGPTSAPTSGPTSELEQRLRSYVAGKLSAPERPAVYRFGAELPRNALGKLSDWPV